MRVVPSAELKAFQSLNVPMLVAADCAAAPAVRPASINPAMARSPSFIMVRPAVTLSAGPYTAALVIIC